MSQQASEDPDSENRIQEGESRETGAESGDQALDIWRGENNDGVICFLKVITVRGDPGEIVEIRKRDSKDDPLESGFRLLKDVEKTALKHFFRKMMRKRKKADQRNSRKPEGTTPTEYRKSTEFSNIDPPQDPPDNTFLSLQDFVAPHFAERIRNRMEREQQTQASQDASREQIEAGDSQEGRSRTETTHFSPLGEASVENSNPQQVTINENIPSSTEQSSEPMRNSPKSPSRSLDAVGQAPSPLPPEPLSASNHASLIEDQRTVRPTPSRVFSEVVGVPYQEEEDTEMALVPAEITQTSSTVETESKTNEQADSNPPTVAAGKADEKEEAVPPSSDLSDCEDELAGSQEEDSGDEPISEVLAKRIAGRADQRPPRASRPKDLPQYLDELLADEDEYVPCWADKSVSDLVKHFIEDRESIFEMQKSFRSLKKEAEALAIVTTRRSHIDNLKHRNYLDELSTYIAFFRIMKLNPFPISNALVAVYMYQYRAQWPEESRAKTAHALGLFARWTSPLFGNDDPRLIRLNNWEGADEVIKEMERSLRKTMKTRSDMTAATSQSVSPSSSRAAVHSTVAAQPSRSVSGTPSHSTPSIPQLESRETTATPTLPPPQKKRKAGRPRLSASNSRTKNPSEPPSVKEISPAPSSTSETVSRKIRRNIPLPNVRDRFESLRAVKMSTAASLIYSQGYAIGANPNATETTVSIYCRGPGPGAKGCSFRIHASFDAEEDLWKVDSRIAQHTHKPSTTLNDPDWRPRTTDLDIIEAIRQIDEYNQLDENLRKVTKEKRALRRSTASEPPSKRIRTTSPTPSVSISESIVESQEPRESSTRANSPSPAPFLKSDVASSLETSFDTPVEPSIGLVAGVSHLLPTGERTAESVEASAERYITTPMVESKPILPSPPRSSRTPTSVPPLARIPTVDSSTPNDERSFYSTPQVPAAGQQLDLSAPPVPQVAAFLASFDPSLTVLAPYLQAAGYSTLNALVEFALLSPRVRKIVFKSISARTDTGVDPRLFDLLDQRLTEAREAGWV
ncbi:hypothetical protein JCM3765_000678 [Sporobolomyces pararoseus]